MAKHIAIIGGGFYGMYLAEFMALQGHKVSLFERHHDFMQEASYVNQARVHQGYHYPRSILTAQRSRLSFARFVAEFKECISGDFDKYYLIGKFLSKVSAKQFSQFCQRINAPLSPAPDEFRAKLNMHYVEDAFRVEEVAFDSVKIKHLMKNRLAAAGVQCFLGCAVTSVQERKNGCEIDVTIDGQSNKIFFNHVFNTTYASLNSILKSSGLPSIPLKHELTEMCLVEVPPELRKLGITVMCGPFFSVMPFPSTPYHSFSHVRYTPHRTWSNLETAESSNEPLSSAWEAMRHDAARYIPLLAECQYKKSIWAVKTVLPRSEKDDSRPILFKPHYAIPNFHCIMGGKIDNIYDAVNAIVAQELLSS